MSDGPRWILHLPTTLTSLEEAVELAGALRSSLAHLTVLDFGEMTLSEEDGQVLRTRVWCDARVGLVGGRCGRHDGHLGACLAIAERVGQ